MASDLPTWIAALGAGVLGLIVGSFANVAIHRWPRGESVVSPPSACPACGTAIRPRDNIPVVSWLLLRGRCRDCGEPISPRYPSVEAVTGALWATVAAVHGWTWLLPALLAFTWVLVVATVIDLRHRIIPNRLTYRAAPVLLALLAVAAATRGEWGDLGRGIVAGLAIPIVMFLLSEGFRLARGQAGMGMGDVKLAVSIGLVVGYLGGWELLVAFYGTAVAGAAVVVVLLVAGRATLASRIPYGPYLAVGALAAVLAGGPLVDVLQGLLGLG